MGRLRPLYRVLPEEVTWKLRTSSECEKMWRKCSVRRKSMARSVRQGSSRFLWGTERRSVAGDSERGKGVSYSDGEWIGPHLCSALQVMVSSELGVENTTLFLFLLVPQKGKNFCFSGGKQSMKTLISLPERRNRVCVTQSLLRLHFGLRALRMGVILSLPFSPWGKPRPTPARRRPVRRLFSVKQWFWVFMFLCKLRHTLESLKSNWVMNTSVLDVLSAKIK